MKKLLLIISVLLLVFTLASCTKLQCSHEWDVGTLANADECGEGARATYVCKLCGWEEWADATSHVYEKGDTVPASCEGLGYTNYDCVRCGKAHYISDFTDVLGHKYGEPVLINEGTYKNTYKKRCENCGDAILYSSYNEVEEEHDYLSDVEQTFTFDIVTEFDEEFIKENLIILNYYFYHSQYEDSPEARMEFSVTAKGNNVYTITANSNYEYDTTYIAILENEMAFVDHPGIELIYKVIEDPNHENDYEYREGIVFLHALEQQYGGYYPYKLVTSDNGGQLYLIVNKIDELYRGQTICLGEISSMEDVATAKECYFGVITQISRLADGTWMLSLDEPDLQDIFDKLDISYDKEIDFDIDAFNIEQLEADIIDSLYSNDEFVKFLSALNVSADKYFESNGYHAVELSNTRSFMENVTLDPSISFNGSTVHSKIRGAVNIPILNDKNETVGNFSVSFEVAMDSRFVLDVSYKIKTAWSGIKLNNFDIEVTQTDTVSFTFDIAIELYSALETKYVVNLETGELHRSCCIHVTNAADPSIFEDMPADRVHQATSYCELCKPMGATDEEDIFESYYADTLNCSDWKQVAEDIKSMANSSGSSANEGKKGITLGSVEIPLYGPVVAKLELALVMSMDIEAVMRYNYTFEKIYTYGMSLGSDNILHPQMPKSNNTSITNNNLSLMGKARVEAGLLVDMGVIIKGLEKWFNAGVSAEVGAYSELNGILDITNNYVGAYLETGAYLKLDMYYKVVSTSGGKDLAAKEWPLLHMGFENVYYAYDAYVESVNLGACNKAPLDIQTAFLKVKYFNLKTMQEGTDVLSLYERSKYRVTLQLESGEYCYISGGKIYVRANVPDYFEDKLIIKVTADNEWNNLSKYSNSAYNLAEYVIDLYFIPTEEHSWLDATCTEPETCRYCGKTQGDERGHSWMDATCNAPKTCRVCGETTGAKLKHIYNEEDYTLWYEEGCEYNAVERAPCARGCGKYNYREIPDTALEHIYSVYVPNSPAECEVNETEISYCDRGCGEWDIRDIEGTALEHQFTTWTEYREATCTSKNILESNCDLCGAWDWKYGDVAALGHDWTPATCLDPKTCLRCQRESGKPLGHDWVDATCQEPEHCSRCPETIGDVIDCIESGWILGEKPTVEKNGYEYIECIMCHTIFDYRILNFTDGSKYLIYTLNSDGESYTVTGIDPCDDTEICIPELYNGKPVTGISVFAFDSATNIQTVYIPATVTHIDHFAFTDCKNLTRIEFYSTMTNSDGSKINTMAQWKSITKGMEWKFNTGDFKVYCVDGVIPKSES